jgi:hypothetical protein
MSDVEVLQIGKRYRVDGKFNYGDQFQGTLAAVSEHFLGWTDCEGLRAAYGDNQKNFITHINSVSTLAPVEE